MVDILVSFYRLEWKGEELVIIGKITALQPWFLFKKVNKIMKWNWKKWRLAVHAALYESIASRYRFLAAVLLLELHLIVTQIF